MTRPHLTLEKWLSTETDLKKEFLEQEILLRPNEINKRVKSGEKEIFYSKNHPQIKVWVASTHNSSVVVLALGLECSKLSLICTCSFIARIHFCLGPDYLL